jgi:gliding motility-associated lipoprotein GldH
MKIVPKIKFHFYIGFITLLLSACTGNTVFHKYVDINPNAWQQDSAAVFVFEATDTVSDYDVIIEIRNKNEYPYQNLYLFVYSTSPDSVVLGDTLNCILADNQGRFYGRGIASYNLPILYMSKINFPKQGEYTFEIKQGMREEELRGISNIGLKIQKAN